MACTALFLLAAAYAKPTIIRVRAGDGALRRVAFDEDETPTIAELCERARCDALHLDEACAEACRPDATLASLDITHGSIVYAPRDPPRAPAPEAAPAEAFYSPYPELAKRKTLVRARKQNTKTHTWKELMKERAGIFYVKSFERVCDVARLDQKAVEALAAGGAEFAWVLGARGTGELNATVDAEVFHAAGAEDDAVFALAAAAGLEVVGCAVHRTEASEENVLLTAREVAFAAECQLEAMRRSGDEARPVAFATIVLAESASGLKTEAFEASELAVQMAAERVLAPAAEQPGGPEAFVATREPVVVKGEDVSAVDPRFLYRAVGVEALPSKPPLASGFAASAAGAKYAAAKSRAKRAAALKAHLFAGGRPSRKKLTARLLDFGALLAARAHLAKGDADAVCAVAAGRRADPKLLLPAEVATAVEAAFVGAGGEEE